MKRFLLPALLTISAFSGVSALSRDCVNVGTESWCKGGCGSDGACSSIMLINRELPIRRVKVRGPNGDFIMDYDCKLFKRRYISSDGSKSDWDQAIPGSIGMRDIEVGCGMHLPLNKRI